MEPCDFCGTLTDDPVEYAIDPTDVPISVTPLDGRILKAILPVPGIWRSCPSCTRLVEVGDAKALLDRGHHLALGHVSALVALSRSQRRQVLREHRAGLRRLHDRFWMGYTEDTDEQGAA